MDTEPLNRLLETNKIAYIRLIIHSFFIFS